MFGFFKELKRRRQLNNVTVELFPHVDAIIRHTYSADVINDRKNQFDDRITVRSKPDLYAGDIIIWMPAKNNRNATGVYIARVECVVQGRRGWDIVLVEGGLCRADTMFEHWCDLTKHDVSDYFGDVNNSRQIQYI